MPRGSAQAADGIDLARVAAALAEMTRDADLVVVSTGPLHLSASALIWARAGDATIVVAVRDVSRRDDVTYAVESLRLVGVQPRGAILAERHRSLGRGLVGGTRPEPMAEPTPDLVTPVTPAVVPARRTRAPRATRGPGSGETGS